MEENVKRTVVIADDLEAVHTYEVGIADDLVAVNSCEGGDMSGHGPAELARTSHFSAGRNMKVFVGSWNVGNKRPEGLANFLPSADADYDIIAIGLQESTYAHVEEDHSQNAAHVAANIVLDACIHHFKQELSNVLGSDYYIVQHVRRAQLQLYIFAKAELQKSISDVNWSAENTGFLHVFPNKGGLCCTFKVDGTTLAFISCHLTAHEGAKNCALRNDSTKEILGGVRAGDKRFDVSVQFHHTFWMGDMNYRLDLGEEDKRDHSSDAVEHTNIVKQVWESASGRYHKRASTSESMGAAGATGTASSEHHPQEGTSFVRHVRESISGRHHKRTSTSEAIGAPSEQGTPAGDAENYGGGGGGGIVKRFRESMSGRHHKRTSTSESGPLDTSQIQISGDGDTASDVPSIADDEELSSPSKRNPHLSALEKRVEKLRKVLDLIAEEKWSELLAYDELDREMKEGRVLGGFTALTPNFPPTFKRSRRRYIHKRAETAAVPLTAGEGGGEGVPSQEEEEDAGKVWCLSTKGNNNITLGSKKKSLNAAVHMGLEAVSTKLMHSTKGESSKTHKFFGMGSQSNHGPPPAASTTTGAVSSTSSANGGSTSVLLPPPTVAAALDGDHPLEEEESEAESEDDEEELELMLSTGRSGKSSELGDLHDEHFPASKYFYDKKRIPSYTDRILYRSLAGFKDNLTPLYFESCEIVSSSDHKPVRAGFRLHTIGGDHDILIRKESMDDVASFFNRGSSSKKLVKSTTPAHTTLELKFSELKGSKLAEMDSPLFGGGSDPYIVITADPPHILENSIKSTIIMHNLDPDWGKETLSVKFTSPDITGLSRNAHLIISVWDYDRTNSDDLIGVFALPLKVVIDNATSGSPYRFNEELFSNGDHNGFLEGKVEVIGSVADVEQSFEKLESERKLRPASEPQMSSKGGFFTHHGSSHHHHHHQTAPIVSGGSGGNGGNGGGGGGGEVVKSNKCCVVC